MVVVEEAACWVVVWVKLGCAVGSVVSVVAWLVVGRVVVGPWMQGFVGV
jgi:hypothetical protein